MNVSFWSATRALSLLLLAVAALALGDAAHSGAARAQIPGVGASLSFTTDAPAKGVVGGTSVTGTITYRPTQSDVPPGPRGSPSSVTPSSGFSLTPACRSAGVLQCATPTPSSGFSLVGPGGPLPVAHLSQPVTVTLGTPCLNFAGTCPAPAATVPTSIDVHPGEPTTFSITTTPVDSEDDVALVAVYGDLTGQTVLKVMPPALVSLSLAYHDPLLQGDSFTLNPCLNGPAPSGGEAGQYTVDNWPLLGGEGGASFTIDPGAKCGSYQFTAAATGSVTFTVSINGVSKQATLTVSAPAATPTPTATPGGPAVLTGILIDGRGVDGPFYSSPGGPVTVIVGLGLTANAPTGGAKVSIAVNGPVLPGDNDSAVLVDVPTAITIAQGTPSTTFQMMVEGCTFSDICDAELDASYQGVTVKAVVQTQCPSCAMNTP